MRQEILEDFEPIYTYLTWQDEQTHMTKYAYALNKILIALAKSSGHLPPQFFLYTGFDKAKFFNGNQPIFSAVVNSTLTHHANNIKSYLVGNTFASKEQALSSLTYLQSAFGQALDIIFSPKIKYLEQYHIHPQGVPGFTIFSAERDQLLPLLKELSIRIQDVSE
jgi:hypothetical protein